MEIGFVGVGKLGTPVSVECAIKGHNVRVYDIDSKVLQELNRGFTSLYEPNLQDKLRTVLKDGHYHITDLKTLVDESQIIFIAVPTPSQENKSFKTTYVKDAVQSIVWNMNRDNSFKVIVVISTVLPTTIRNEVLPIIQEARLKGKNCGLCYNAYFIAMGTTAEDWVDPEFVLIGENTLGGEKLAGNLLEKFYRTVVSSETPIFRMTYEEAELTKMGYNVFISFKITVANTLMEFADKIPHLDVDVVSNALSHANRRIVGPKYLRGGMTDSGACVPPSSRILTDIGFREISTIGVGDKVLAHDGRYHKVTKTFKRPYKGDMIEVIPQGESAFPIQATPEHPIWMAERYHSEKHRFRISNHNYDGYNRNPTRLTYMTEHSKLFFNPIEKIEYGDLLSLPSFKESLFPVDGIDIVLPVNIHDGRRKVDILPSSVKLNLELMYFFGLFLAEGNTWNREIDFAFHKNEIAFVDEINSITKKNFGVKTKLHAYKGNGITLRLTCAPLARYLVQTFGKYAWGKHIPWDWLKLPSPFVEALVKGLWYGDGSKSGEELWFQTTSKDIFDWLRVALLKLHIAFRCQVYGERIGKDHVKHRPSYMITVASSSVEEMERMLPLMRSEYKEKKMRTIWWENDNMLYHTSGVGKFYYEGDVYNLEVEGANSYVLEGGVLHNCHPRDGEALSWLCEKLDISVNPFKFVTEARYSQTKYLANLAIAKMNEYDLPLVILGKRFKPKTNLTDYSSSLLLSDILHTKGVPHIIYDPLLDGERVFSESAVFVATVMDEDFKEFPFPKGSFVIDVWRFLKEKEGVTYYKVGGKKE